MGSRVEEADSVTTWLRRSILVVPVLLVLVPLIMKSSYVGGLYTAAMGEYRARNYFFAAEFLKWKQDKDARDYGLLGWTLLRSGDMDDAAANFRRSLALDPDLPNSYCGMGTYYLRKGSTWEALDSFTKGAAEDSRDIDCLLGKGMLLEKLGKTTDAMDTYSRVLYLDGENDDAENEFTLLAKKTAIGPLIKPARTLIEFRAQGDYFEALEEGRWERVYLKGVNIGPPRPGEFPSTPPVDEETYRRWLEQIADMNANMVRAYTILPPAFYRALKAHNMNSPKKLWLFQEIWLEERDEHDLYDRAWTKDFKNEVKYATDVIHGQARIPYRRGHAFGVYNADVSEYVFAFGLGRELEPSVVVHTNKVNAGRTSYRGRFVFVEKGSPSETWFAEKADFAIGYEMDTYNCQRPVTIVNWPPLDPMYHVTELTYAEELRIRKARGGGVDESVPKFVDDADAVSLDIRNLKATSAYRAGFFAAYHVYSYWPDFLLYDPEYAKATDAEGSDRYLGYLLDLKKNHPGMPLLIAEYGVPASWGIAHVHPDGWHNGGIPEEMQAGLLMRMTRNIRDAGCAGGLVFSWHDEWWKGVADNFTAPFSKPVNRRPLWHNMMDPEQNFGIMAFEPVAPVPLLRGNPGDWKKSTALASGEGSLRGMSVYSDEAYLYIRLDLDNAPFAQSGVQYWLALNTLPGEAGTTSLPKIPLRLEKGANFLITLAPNTGELYISANYNPHVYTKENTRPPIPRVLKKKKMKVKIGVAAFEDILTEANQRRYDREGRLFPPIFTNRSPLRQGTVDPSDPAHFSIAAWHAGAEEKMIEMRIPWGLLYVMDPSSRTVFDGTDRKGNPLGTETKGVSIAAVEIVEEGGSYRLAGSLPAAAGGSIASPPLYSWEKWDYRRYTERLKPAYYALRDAFEKTTPPVGEQKEGM
jgi:tetratricopeptide (TPR) repeat protein